MPCLLIVLVAAFPRVVLAALFFLTTYLNRAYESLIVLILGFLFLPVTTLVYAWMINNGHRPEGTYLVALIVTALFDLGWIGNGAFQRRVSS